MSTVVRTIVCAYSVSELPMSWVQVHRRFESAVTKAKLAIRVRLTPLEALPDEFEVLVVPPALFREADKVGGGARILAATRENALAVATTLIEEIQAGVTLRAEPRVEGAPKVVIIRGGDEV